MCQGASVHPHATDVFSMSRVVKQVVLAFIRPCVRKNCILLVELHQGFLGLFVMHKTEMPPVNVVIYVRREGIKPRTNF